jgi:murein DD-endopeptidase MepM/ murein hydrolase activator NlpD
VRAASPTMKRLFVAITAMALAAALLSPLPGRSVPLPERIDAKRHEVERAKRTEGVLTHTIARLRERVDALDGRLRTVQRTLTRVQRELDSRRLELIRLRDRLESARDRLERERRRLQQARRMLAKRLVELYKADLPDAVTVVLEADGFADLLERAEFFDRLADQDRRVFALVRRLRDRARARAAQLAELEEQVERQAIALLQRRDDVAATRDQIDESRSALRAARETRQSALGRVRNQRVQAQEDLQALEAEQARVAQRLRQAAAAPATPPAGPIRQDGGALIWPVNGTITSPFGPRWGRLHAGLDIGAPEGAPIRAAAAGRVVLAGWQGGYGLYTCIQHSGSLATCYAHQSRLGTSTGATVGQGEVMGYVGNTGNSFGAHLHFEVRVGGSPVDPLGYL